MVCRSLLPVVLFVALALSGCGRASVEPAAQNPSTGEPLPVLASTSIVADIVGQIGGEHVQVSSLVPLAGDPHSFEPTPQDLARVSDARLIFVNGAGYELFLDRLLTNTSGGAKLVDLSAGITLRELSEEEEHAHAEETGHAGEEEHSAAEEADHAAEGQHSDAEEAGHAEDEAHAGEVDPHTWTDPNNIQYWTQAIATALGEADPANAAAYRANAERYNAELSELDGWIGEQFAAVPEDRRLLVTDHAVFGYLADRYGLRQVGTLLPGFSSAAEPSAQDLAALQDTIAELDVRTIFVGDLANEALAEQLAQDTGTRLVPVLTESLTPPDGEGATYIDYMRYNVRTMAEALGES